MRRLLLPTLLLFCLASLAQKNLSGSLRGSALTYVYRINSDEAGQLYRSGIGKKIDRYLHTLVDSFRYEAPSLAPGNYLFASARGNRLHTRLNATGDVAVKILNNNRDLVVALHNRQGDLLPGATVTLGRKHLAYDAATQTYRREKQRKGGLLQARYQGVHYAWPVEKSRQYTLPLHKRLWAGVKRLFAKKRRPYYDFLNRTAHEQRFRGFLVCSQPKYKPGDTVRLKAFVTDKDGKPYSRPLLLRLSDRALLTDTILADVGPYRAGAFDYQFVLTDSLDLDLDTNYLLTLEEQGSRKFNLDDYDGDLDDEEYAAKRLVVMRHSFYLEEYELDAITFSARGDKEVHSRGEEASVYLKASDENGLAVMDGRVDLLVQTGSFTTSGPGQAPLFLSDTLWRWSQALEPAGETRIILPDSIFPAANFAYQVECVFRNSNNERQTQTVRQNFRRAPARIFFRLAGDSLFIDHLVSGKSRPAEAELYAFTNEDDSLLATSVQLPLAVKVHPLATRYTVKTPEQKEEYTIRSTPTVSAQSLRTPDSVFIRLVNPASLPVWYTVFAGNRVVKRGYGTSFFYAEKSATNRPYFFSLQYLFGNKAYNQDFNVPFHNKLLSVNLVQPATVYPGQTATLTVEVTNAGGQPVANADVTAWSYTQKFTNGRLPGLPYFGRQYPGRKRYANFKADEEADKTGRTALAWQRWSRQMHLDTVEYYRFLHPELLYTNTEPAPDSLTQVAPFVVKNGELVPVHQLYIDEVPVFFSASENLLRYSFAASPGRHHLRLRTPNAMITLDSLVLERGMKTVISIEASETNSRIRLQKQPPRLTAYEQTLWSRYMLLLQNDFGAKYVYVDYGLQVFGLLPQGYGKPQWVGPLARQSADLVVKNGFTQRFDTEGNYHYFISKGLIKQKQLPERASFRTILSPVAPEPALSHQVLTVKELDSLWQEYLYHRSASTELFYNPAVSKEGNGKLQIAPDNTPTGEPLFIRNIFLFRYDDPDYLRVYPGSRRDLGYVQPGRYRLLLLLRDDAYLVKDSVFIRPNGLNFYPVGVTAIRPKDSTSRRISAIVNEREPYSYNQADFNSIKETFNRQYFDRSQLTGVVSGVVLDKEDRPLAGASVMLKGSGLGTITDRQGRFYLHVPNGGSLVVNAVGYTAEERKLKPGDTYRFLLTEVKYNLDEVVVVGYGTTRKRSATAALSQVRVDGELFGKIPGIMIRGTNTIDSDKIPLLIVDGLPYAGSVEDLDPALIATTNVLNGDAAMAIYGAQAVNGAVIITTKGIKGNPAEGADAGLPAASSLRQQFRDYAYWQPRLRTDAQGKASFTVTYPDDITAWRSFALVMAPGKQTGSAEGLVRSFKTISGNLALPQFAVEGDTIVTIAKALNYSADTISVTRQFYINNGLQSEKSLRFRNAWIDSFTVVAPAADSLKLKYTVQKEDGYLDGEERSLPLFRPGVLETTGFFAALRQDTAFTLPPFTDTGTLKIYAESSVLPTLEKEVEYLRNYEYLCNEQLASKLKGLLVQKRIDSFYKRPFRWHKQVRDIVSKLVQNRSPSGLWGWWANNEPAYWISLHATEALLEAAREGYAMSINKPALTDYLVYQLERQNSTKRFLALRLLQAMEARVDYQRYTDSLARHLPSMSLYEKLRLAGLKQAAGLPYSLDSLLVKQKKTLFGNIYWGEENDRFFDNAVQNSVLMYRLLRQAGGYTGLLEKLRGYFLESRRKGYWRNTYEAALILETVLPDLLAEDPARRGATLTLSGSLDARVTDFPYTAVAAGGQALTIRKEGALPVYFTAYQQHWNRSPKRVAGDFSVTTSFQQNNRTVNRLKAGEPVVLGIEVTVNADAQYVLIEAPIPAGCSYQDKPQPRTNNEVHREYFKNKVSLFCSTLKKGSYRFTVPLLPRYSGRYTLNPARAEMMYFPVFYGREEIKRMEIE